MLQVFYLNVAYVAVAIHICCKLIFQMFQLFSDKYIVSVLSGCCCSDYTYTFPAYVSLILRRILQQMLHVASVSSSRRGKRAQAEAVPTCMCSNRRVGVVACEQQAKVHNSMRAKAREQQGAQQHASSRRMRAAARRHA